MKPIRSLSKPMRAALSAALLLAGAALVSCDARDQVAGGSDETHSSIVDIQGRVLTKDARPFGNVVVRLRGLGLYDTTDSDGAFRFRLDSLPMAAGRALAAVDTLDYLRDGQAILSAAVPAWVATMPDVMLVQRDLSGSISGDLEGVGRIACLLGLPDGTSQQFDLELNRAAHRFSGFAYFRYSGGVDSFTAVARAFDDSGRLLGRSVLLHFSSRAGDIAFPEFDVGNAVPAIHLFAEVQRSGATTWPKGSYADTLDWSRELFVGQGQIVRLHALVYDTFGRGARVEWNLGTGWIAASPSLGATAESCPACYQDTASAGAAPALRRILYRFDTIVVVTSNAMESFPQEWTPRVRVSDKEGVAREQQLRASMVLSEPYARVSFGMGMALRPSSGDTIRVHMHDSDSHGGRIVSRFLYVGRKVADTLRIYGSGQTIVPASCGDDGSGWSFGQQVPTPECVGVLDPKEVEYFGWHFEPIGDSIPVSGADTSLILPVGVVGELMVGYRVIDNNRQAGLAHSPGFMVGPRAPRIDTVFATADSIELRWSTIWVPRDQDSVGLSWMVSWYGAIWGDTGTVVLGRDARSLRLPRDPGVGSRRYSVSEVVAGIVGAAAAAELSTYPPFSLTFDGADEDPSRLHGAAFSQGGGRASLHGMQGAALWGSVARLHWTVGDSAGASIAGATFELEPQTKPRSLRLDVVNRSSLPMRAFLVVPDEAAFAPLRARGLDLGWEIPANFSGHIALALDSAAWPAWAGDADTTEVDRLALLDAIQGVGFRVQTWQDPVVRIGDAEFDNIRWE